MHVEVELIVLVHMTRWVLCLCVEVIYAVRVECGRLFAIEDVIQARWMSETEDTISNRIVSFVMWYRLTTLAYHVSQMIERERKTLTRVCI